MLRRRVWSRLYCSSISAGIEIGGKPQFKQGGTEQVRSKWYSKVQELWNLQQYKLACISLKDALATAPELQELYEKCLLLKEQSELGTHNLSEFYRRGCPDEEAPDGAEFVGPVEIKVTQDGRGRGLFLTKDVEKGELLLVNNAAARVDQQETPAHLLAEVLRACTASKRTLAQIYTMAEPSQGSSSEMVQKGAPSMELFRPNWSMETTAGSDVPEMDATRIRSIIDCSRECGADFVGLWTLPAFINHSCLPNASVRKYGRLLLVFAAKKLNQGEELVRSYKYCLQPIKGRLSNETSGRFVCGCRRCILESKLMVPLHDVTEVYLRLVAERSEVGHQDFVGVAMEVQAIMRSFCETSLEQLWLLASYPLAFHSLVTRLSGKDLQSFSDKAMEAFHETAPGDVMTLKTLLFYSRFGSDRGLEVLQEECYAAYGHVSIETMKAILQQAFHRG